ncbi:MAG: helix-turn-helix transcriptional regulator, partial [Bacteroidaceae bacterium]|nr:helix-turn-helix transcriptional regulator [Bacteroidaceae bacterium]
QFEKECGISLSDALLDYRLHHACELLENTDYILEVVAEESGFGSSRTFYRQFRNPYNLTPNAYRTMSQEAKNNQVTAH